MSVNKWFPALVAAAAMAVLVPTTSFATTGTRIDTRVPFAFTAGDETFPAGSYELTVDNPDHPAEVVIQQKNGGRVGVLTTEVQTEDAPARQSKLVFDQYGKDHFLAKVYVAGFDEARVLSKTAIQREYAKLLRQEEVPAQMAH